MKFAVNCLAIVVLIALINASKPTKDKNDKPHMIVCYWGSWSFYRPGKGKFTAEDVNPYLCTHLVYGFTKLVNNAITVFDPDLDTGDTNWESGEQWGEGMYRRFNHLRSVNPHTTTMISIGGWNEGSDKYSHMVSDANSRKTFVSSVVAFLQKYDFDGLDLDWEYPAMKAVGDQDRTPGNAADKQNYIDLLRELHEAFQPHGYVLSAAVSAGKPTIDRAYNVPEMTKYLDIINLMSYDFHGGWEQHTGHNAPLYPRPNDTELDKEFTLEYAVDYWIKLGADPKKIVMGLPLYARTFTLANPSEYGIGAKTTGAGGNKGPYTEELSMLGYNEVCEAFKAGDWKMYRDDTQKVPYAVKGNQWVGYDDQQSIKDKVDFLIKKGLGGGMVWSIDTDDFKGFCGKGKYPLLKVISKQLIGVDGPDPIINETHATPTHKPTHHPTTHNPTQKQTHTTGTIATGKPGSTVIPTHGPTSGPDGDFVCKKEGFFADPKDKTIYHECIDMGDHLKDMVYHCGPGTVWDEVNKVCKMA